MGIELRWGRGELRWCWYIWVISVPKNGLLLPQGQSKPQHCVTGWTQRCCWCCRWRFDAGRKWDLLLSVGGWLVWSVLKDYPLQSVKWVLWKRLKCEKRLEMNMEDVTWNATVVSTCIGHKPGLLSEGTFRNWSATDAWILHWNLKQMYPNIYKHKSQQKSDDMINERPRWDIQRKNVNQM